jgi:hypothetical protein
MRRGKPLCRRTGGGREAGRTALGESHLLSFSLISWGPGASMSGGSREDDGREWRGVDAIIGEKD